MPETKQKVPQALKDLWFVTLGALSLSAEEVRKTVEQFARRGSISRSDARKIVSQVTSRVEKNRKVLEKKIHESVSLATRQLKVPSSAELQGILKKVTGLAKQVSRSSKGDSKPSPAAPRRSAARRSRRRAGG